MRTLYNVLRERLSLMDKSYTVVACNSHYNIFLVAAAFSVCA